MIVSYTITVGVADATHTRASAGGLSPFRRGTPAGGQQVEIAVDGGVTSLQS